MLFFVLLGFGLVVLGFLLITVGKMFYAIGRLLRKGGGDIEPEKGMRAAWYGALLILVGGAIIYITMKVSR
jgi:hypothetical protein